MDAERLKGNLDLLLLSVLAAGPAHGYAVITAVRERSEGVFDLGEGTVRAVVRAHQTRHGQAAIVLDRLARTVWGAAAVVALLLSAVAAVVLVVAAAKGLQHPSPDEPTPAVALVVASGPAGAALIGGYLVARCLLRDRRDRRRIRRG
jgi:hypothetical protein